MPLTPEQKKTLEAEMQQYVGKPIGPPAVGRDLVNEPMIRQWCDAMDDANSAYLDPAAAKESVHGSIIAPPTMLQAWTMQGYPMAFGYDEPQNNEHRLHKLLEEHGYTGVLATNTEQGYDRELHPGDEVTSVTVIEEISEEKATAVGIGYFIKTRTTYENQRGEQVGWLDFRVLKFIPAQQPQAATEAAAAPSVPQRIRAPMGHDNTWWWDRVNADEIPIQKCNQCGALHHPPRPMCNQCQGMDLGHIAASGKGTVHTYTIIHYPQFPGYDFPIVAALIDLEEGTKLMSNVVECDPKDVHIGMSVQGFVHEGEDGLKLPVFRPVK